MTRILSWKFFHLIAEAMGIAITPQLAGHPFCQADPYASTGTALTDLDYEANHWQFQ